MIGANKDDGRSQSEYFEMIGANKDDGRSQSEYFEMIRANKLEHSYKGYGNCLVYPHGRDQKVETD